MTRKYVKLRGDRNQCPACCHLFNSTAAFEKHRRGEFGIDRRCLTADEMLAKRMARNADGYWITAANPMHTAAA